ncbi:hypothetical protein M0R45_019518 [Rubus argutus]|uniref:Uncharacterized protein n=1 Tax=Rubus argutus TaxID=59490 RepID=A0AAW1X6B6_RUBAR
MGIGSRGDVGLEFTALTWHKGEAAPAKLGGLEACGGAGWEFADSTGRGASTWLATRSAGCRRWRDLGLLLGTAVKEETPAELLEATDIGGLGFAASKWHRTLASMVKVQLAGFGFGLPWSGAGEQQRCAAWMGFAKAREQPCDGSGD